MGGSSDRASWGEEDESSVVSSITTSLPSRKIGNEEDAKSDGQDQEITDDESFPSGPLNHLKSSPFLSSSDVYSKSPIFTQADDTYREHRTHAASPKSSHDHRLKDHEEPPEEVDALIKSGGQDSLSADLITSSSLWRTPTPFCPGPDTVVAIRADSSLTSTCQSPDSRRFLLREASQFLTSSYQGARSGVFADDVSLGQAFHQALERLLNLAAKLPNPPRDFDQACDLVISLADRVTDSFLDLSSDHKSLEARLHEYKDIAEKKLQAKNEEINMLLDRIQSLEMLAMSQHESSLSPSRSRRPAMVSRSMTFEDSEDLQKLMNELTRLRAQCCEQEETIDSLKDLSRARDELELELARLNSERREADSRVSKVMEAKRLLESDVTSLRAEVVDLRKQRDKYRENWEMTQADLEALRASNPNDQESAQDLVSVEPAESGSPILRRAIFSAPSYSIEASRGHNEKLHAVACAPICIQASPRSPPEVVVKSRSTHFSRESQGLVSVVHFEHEDESPVLMEAATQTDRKQLLLWSRGISRVEMTRIEPLKRGLTTTSISCPAPGTADEPSRSPTLYGAPTKITTQVTQIATENRKKEAYLLDRMVYRRYPNGTSNLPRIAGGSADSLALLNAATSSNYVVPNALVAHAPFGTQVETPSPIGGREVGDFARFEDAIKEGPLELPKGEEHDSLSTAQFSSALLNSELLNATRPSASHRPAGVNPLGGVPNITRSKTGSEVFIPPSPLATPSSPPDTGRRPSYPAEESAREPPMAYERISFSTSAIRDPHRNPHQESQWDARIRKPEQNKAENKQVIDSSWLQAQELRQAVVAATTLPRQVSIKNAWCLGSRNEIYQSRPSQIKPVGEVRYREAECRVLSRDGSTRSVLGPGAEALRQIFETPQSRRESCLKALGSTTYGSCEKFNSQKSFDTAFGQFGVPTGYQCTRSDSIPLYVEIPNRTVTRVPLREAVIWTPARNSRHELDQGNDRPPDYHDRPSDYHDRLPDYNDRPVLRSSHAALEGHQPQWKSPPCTQDDQHSENHRECDDASQLGSARQTSEHSIPARKRCLSRDYSEHCRYPPAEFDGSLEPIDDLSRAYEMMQKSGAAVEHDLTFDIGRPRYVADIDRRSGVPSNRFPSEEESYEVDSDQFLLPSPTPKESPAHNGSDFPLLLSKVEEGDESAGSTDESQEENESSQSQSASSSSLSSRSQSVFTEKGGTIIPCQFESGLHEVRKSPGINRIKSAEYFPTLVVPVASPRLKPQQEAAYKQDWVLTSPNEHLWDPKLSQPAAPYHVNMRMKAAHRR